MESKSVWLTDKYIFLMLFAFPLWTGLKGYSALTVSKFIFFTAATGVWLIGLIIIAATEKEPFRIRGAAQWAALTFLLSACISALFSPYGTAVILGASRYDGLLTLLLYGVIFLGVSTFGRPRKAYVYALAFSASVCCIIAVLQLMSKNPFGLFPGDYTYYDSGYKYNGAFLGTIGNTDVLAAYLCLCIPLFIGTAVLSRDRRDKLLFLPAVLCLYILIQSRVASGILGVCVCFLVCTPYLVSVYFDQKKLTLIACAGSATVVITGLIVVYFWRGNQGTIYELSQLLNGHVDDTFGSSRILIWRETLDIVRQRPLLGGGPDTLTLRSSINFSRYVEETGITLSNHVDNAHNEYLGYLVNIGILGLLAYLCLIIRTVVTLGKRRHSPLIPVLGCALICYWVQSFFGLGLCIIVPLVWIAVGLVNARMED